jgi:hypothetical protein
VEEEVPVPEPTRAGDGETATVAMMEEEPAVVVPVVEMPAEEMPEAGAPGQLEDPWKVTAAAAVSVSANIASTSEGGLGAGPSEGPEYGIS